MPARISVLIPTRQRLSTLIHCVQSCLAHQKADFELVIQDNASTDGTEAFARSLEDKRVRYFRTAARVSMRANFENAVRNATGDYLLMIGDDDGLVPNGIERLVKLCSSGEFDFISWPYLWYYWPATNSDRSGGILLRRSDLFGCSHELAGEAVRDNLLLARHRPQAEEPRIYHGCIARRVVDNLVARTGRVFAYDIPDVYLQVAASLSSRRGLTVGHPVSVIGISRNSTGAAHFGIARSSSGVAAPGPSERFVAESALDKPAAIPFNSAFISTDYYIYASLLILSDVLAPSSDIDHEAWLRRIVHQIASQSHSYQLGVNAKILSSLDERIVERLRRLAAPETECNTRDAVKMKRRSNAKLFRKGRLCAPCGVPDDIGWATRALQQVGAGSHQDRPPYPGWRAAQSVRWLRTVGASWSGIVP